MNVLGFRVIVETNLFTFYTYTDVLVKDLNDRVTSWFQPHLYLQLWVVVIFMSFTVCALYIRETIPAIQNGH